MANKNKGYARIKSITFKNFRNIECGKIDFANGKLDDFYNGRSSITGIYGQNGSGKTAVVLAIRVLKSMLCGKTISGRNLVRVGCDNANITYEFSIYEDSGNQYNVKYSFDLFVPKKDDEYYSEFEESDMREKERARMFKAKPIVKNEHIEYNGISSDGKKIRQKVLFSTKDDYCTNGIKPFGTMKDCDRDSGFDNIINNDNALLGRLLNRRDDAIKKKQSFLFDLDVHEKISENIKNEHDKAIYVWLHCFGLYIIVSTIEEQGIISVDVLPLTLLNVSDEKYELMLKPLDLKGVFTLKGDEIERFETGFININSIISQLIPGVEVQLRCQSVLHSSIDENDITKKYDIVSIRDGKELPLIDESLGIKRLISFATILIAVYNHPSVTFAIDEFDSGIFEDLLGKLVSLIDDSGKGQLIFTSHNLRPLEVLESDSIVFTTTNEHNRFIRLKTQVNNNLRNKYLRIIQRGGAVEELYKNPDQYELELKLALLGLNNKKED